jgi:hypothetical protein
MIAAHSPLRLWVGRFGEGAKAFPRTFFFTQILQPSAAPPHLIARTTCLSPPDRRIGWSGETYVIDY